MYAYMSSGHAGATVALDLTANTKCWPGQIRALYVLLEDFFSQTSAELEAKL